MCACAWTLVASRDDICSGDSYIDQDWMGEEFSGGCLSMAVPGAVTAASGEFVCGGPGNERVVNLR